MGYPRILKPGMVFDPIEVGNETRNRVVSGNEFRYNAIGFIPGTFEMDTYEMGRVVAFGVGCNLRCCACDVGESRDYPDKFGELLSPKDAYGRMLEIKKIVEAKYKHITVGTVDITGCEPTIARGHLMELLGIIANKRDFRQVYISTNGILLGQDKGYLEDFIRFNKVLWMNVSFKAGLPDEFEKKTGAQKEYFEAPFRLINWLRDLDESSDIRWSTSADSGSPVFMLPHERKALFERLIGIDSGTVSCTTENVPGLFTCVVHRMGAIGYNRWDDVGFVKYEDLWDSLNRVLKVDEKKRIIIPGGRKELEKRIIKPKMDRRAAVDMLLKYFKAGDKKGVMDMIKELSSDQLGKYLTPENLGLTEKELLLALEEAEFEFKTTEGFDVWRNIQKKNIGKKDLLELLEVSWSDIQNPVFMQGFLPH